MYFVFILFSSKLFIQSLSPYHHKDILYGYYIFWIRWFGQRKSSTKLSETEKLERVDYDFKTWKNLFKYYVTSQSILLFFLHLKLWVCVRGATRQRVISRQAESQAAVKDLRDCEYIDIGCPPPFGQLIVTVALLLIWKLVRTVFQFVSSLLYCYFTKNCLCIFSFRWFLFFWLLLIIK